MKILKNTVKPFLLGLGLALAILLVVPIKWIADSFMQGKEMNPKDFKHKMEVIRAYFPFRYSEKVDPRFVYTVGEQVQVEHLFAFHARIALKSGFSKVMSLGLPVKSII